MEIDFDFISEIGGEVRQLFLNDPDKYDWFFSIINEYKKNNTYPPNIISTIIDYINLFDDVQNKKLVNNVNSIIQDEDNVENLLSYIFYPDFDEEEEEEEANDVNNKFSLDIGDITQDDEDDDTNINSLDPKAYFNSIVKEVMDILCLSYDISYLLCKKFNLVKDVICQNWISSQEEILKSLRIKIGSEMVPTLKSSLAINPCGIGECPICMDETEIFQFYCGHKLCKDCLVTEIKQLISENQIPMCRQIYEEDSDNTCNSEIMFDDVKKFLDDEKIFEQYQQILLDNEATIFQGVRKCPNDYCDSIITQLDEIQCHVGRCSQCGSFVCLKCHQDCHAPIIDCNKVDDFLTTRANHIRELQKAQKEWVKQENKLINYRINNRSEIHSSFNIDIQKFKFKHKETTRKELKEIDLLKSKVSNLDKQIINLRKTKFHPTLGKEEILSIDREIKDLEIQYNKESVVLKRLQMEYENHQKNSVKELEFLEKEEKILSNAYSRTKDFNSGYFEYDACMNDHAFSRIKFINQDWINNVHEKEQMEVKSENLINGLFKRCPHCKTPIERTYGCNHMTCSVCHFQFCYICGYPWSQHIGYICPKYNLIETKTNVNRKNKKKKNKPVKDSSKSFYQPPMSVEKRVDYFRWNNSFSQFQIQKEKYEELFKDFKNKKDGKLKVGEFTISDSNLCTRNKIAKVLLKDTERSEIKMKTYRIMNEILFAQSIVMWGYPALYYMGNKPDKSMLFEYKLFILSQSIENFVNLLHNPKESTSKDFDTNYGILDRQINAILAMAETF